MAAHHLTIAKASFTAALLRPESVSLTRDSIGHFHTLLDSTVSSCTPTNIQKCKAWLLTFIVPFPTRITAFGKYLASLSKHLPTDDPESKPTGISRACSISRKRLHTLYLLNDLLHHTKYHVQGNREFSTLTSSLPPFLAELVSTTSTDVKPKVQRRLDSLLDIWRTQSYFSNEVITKLRSAIDDSTNGFSASDRSVAKQGSQDGIAAKEASYIMPSTHGDPSTPYYDLPAGNLLPHIMPNSTVPIRPEAIKPLQFLAGPADKSLVQALRDFMQDVDRIDEGVAYAKDSSTEEGLVAEIDALGQVLWRDEATGDIVKGDSYYGWSREFCEKMKRRRKGDTTGGATSRSRSYGSSMSRSRSPDDLNRARRRRDNSRSDSRSRSRSYSPERRPRRSYTPSEPDESERPSFGKASTTASGRPSFVSASRSDNAPPLNHPPPQPARYQHSSPLPPPPFNMQMPMAPFPTSASPPSAAGTPPFPPPPLGLGPNGMPIPPPRPAGYTGPWPPPPPPPPIQQNMGMGFGYGQGAGGPPPPPPPSAGPTGAMRGGRGGGWRGGRY